jgi:hypothetical protein
VAEPALVRVPSAGDQVTHGDPVRSNRSLRQQTEDAGNFTGGQVEDRCAVEEYLTGAGPEEAGQAAEQGRLAARVGADDGGHLAVQDVDVEQLDDCAVVVPEGQCPRGQARAGIGCCLGHPPSPLLLVLARSHRRYGAPTAPVTTPVGSSNGRASTAM